MAASTTEDVLAAIHGIWSPDFGTDLATAKPKIGITGDGDDELSLRVDFGYPLAASAQAWAERVESAICDQLGLAQVPVAVGWQVVHHAVQAGLSPLAQVKNVIAVASGKGGVGKSTTAVNLALGLQAEGARVGVLDADIYGPSVPSLLGLAGQHPVSRDGNSFEPLETSGLQLNSIGFLVDQDQALIWRGPMVTQALQQLVFQTNWRELDYLIVDLPPGTGDTQLTLTQKVPLSGALIVTTPQDIALLDARRGLKMFEKVKVPVLGIVENMSTHVCSACGHEQDLFGSGGGERLAEETGVRLLGRLPLDIQIRQDADAGRPTVQAQPHSTLAQRYRDLARALAAQLSLRPRDHSAAFGEIRVEN